MSEEGGGFDEIVGREEPTYEDERIEELNNELEACKDGRREERFVWFLVLIIIMDLHFFMYMGGWGGPVSITVLEVILLIVLGEKFGVDIINQWLDKVLNTVSRSSQE